MELVVCGIEPNEVISFREQIGLRSPRPRPNQSGRWWKTFFVFFGVPGRTPTRNATQPNRTGHVT